MEKIKGDPLDALENFQKKTNKGFPLETSKKVSESRKKGENLTMSKKVEKGDPFALEWFFISCLRLWMRSK